MGKRPSHRDVRHEAAIHLAGEVVGWLERGGDVVKNRDDIVRDLERAWAFGGFDFAKNLERYGLWCPDAELVEILEGAYHASDTARAAAIKAWVAANDIRPAMELGTRVKYREHIGLITEIRLTEAIYIVSCEAEGHKPREGYLAPYEDVAVIDEPAA